MYIFSLLPLSTSSEKNGKKWEFLETDIKREQLSLLKLPSESFVHEQSE